MYQSYFFIAGKRNRESVTTHEFKFIAMLERDDVKNTTYICNYLRMCLDVYGLLMASA